MLENISISSGLISEQKEEIRVLLEKLKKAEVSAQEGRKIRKKLRRLGFRLRDFVGKTGITREERKKGIIRIAVEKKERIRKGLKERRRLLVESRERKERKKLGIPQEEISKAIRAPSYPSRYSEAKVIKHAIMLAQHKYDTPSKIADILVDTFVGLSRPEATKFAKVALGSYKKHPLIEHAEMIKENPKKIRESYFNAQRIAVAMVSWAKRKYGKDAEYMIFETHEVIEGFLREYYPVMSDSFEEKVLEEARRLLRFPKTINPPHGKVIYDKILSIEAEKGSRSNFPHEQFRHDFKGSSEAKVIGLEDGSLLVKSTKGKRLWKELDYD